MKYTQSDTTIQSQSPRQFAESMLKSGRVPIPLRGKQPTFKGWQKLKTQDLTPSMLERLFPATFRGNVGLLLGAASGNIVDIDLDCPEAIKLAPLFLPPTAMQWGRASNNQPSHWAYRVDTLPAKAAIPFDGENGRSLEIRASNAQSLVFGTYPASDARPAEPVVGQPLAEPATIPWTELEQHVSQLAAAVLVAQCWKPGQRHELALALAGYLFRLGWSVERVQYLVTSIAQVVNDDELADRLTAVRTTFEKQAAGEPHTGWNRLCELLGEKTAKRLRRYLAADHLKMDDGNDDILQPFLQRHTKPRETTNAAKLEKVRPQTSPDQAAEPTRHKPQIEVTTDEFAVNNRVLAELPRCDGVYQRGGYLCRVIIPDAMEPTTTRSTPSLPTIRLLEPASCRELLTSQIEFGTYVKDKFKPCHPPSWCVSAILARGAYPGVPTLDGVLGYPVILPDGQIIATCGYHAAIRSLIHIPRGLSLCVPDQPTRDDAVKAVAVIHDILADFPFEYETHRAACLAALLTPLAYYLFEGPAPLFLIDGNTRGCGKGLLADVIGLTLTGERLSILNYTPDRDELRKRITAIASEGTRLVLLDNLTGPFGNDVLDAALTGTTWTDRLLGTNQTMTAPLQITWLATGNNVQIGADTSRRVCHIRLETPDERPELRDGFRYPNLREYIRQHRGELLSAALTILRGWIAAGRPQHGLPRWGSYEGWSSTVREAIVWAGLPDPGETRLEMQTTADRDAAGMTMILKCLRQLDPEGRGLTAAEIIERCEPVLLDRLREPYLAEMHAALEELCAPKLNARTLGYKFRQFKRRNFGGLMLDQVGDNRDGVTRWVVRPVGAASRKHQGKNVIYV